MPGERICRPSFDPLEPRLLFTTFTVTNTLDSGAGSLRQAIIDANANDGADEIEFDIAADSKLIKLNSALPNITEDLTLDGTSATELSANPVIEINGKVAGSTANGLKVTSGALIVKQLAITGFNGAGIYISSDDCVVQECRIGTDPTGKLDRGNKGSGIVIDGASDCLIGGIQQKSANIIAFNGRGATGLVPGILLFGGGTGNAILGNSIFSNRSQAIDLVRTGTEADGINPADILDPDTGTNKLQNQPFMSFVTQFPTETHVQFTMRAAASKLYRIEFFVNPVLSVGSIGTKTFLAAEQFASDAQGNLNVSFKVPKTNGVFFTATATDPDDNTSEVSLSVKGNAGNVTGTVFDDANTDGKRQSTEPGIAGVIVFADTDNDGTLDLGEPQATTSSKGKYTIQNLQGGATKIRVLLPSGRRVTVPAAGAFSLNMPSTSASNRNFGLTRFATISGFVYTDTNENHSRNDGEPGLSGWTVFIDKDNDGVRDSNEKRRITGTLGEYRFTGLGAGKYVLRVIAPNGFVASFPNPAKQSVTLAAAQLKTGRNFGFLAS